MKRKPLVVLTILALFALTIAVGGCSSTGGTTRTDMQKREGTVIKEVKHGEGNQTIEESMDVPTSELYGTASRDTGTKEAEKVDWSQALAYRVGAGDILSLHSLDDSSLDGPAMVRFDGFVSFPQIPDVYVEGLTREQATAAVADAYSKVFDQPQLSLTVDSITSRNFTVMGNVAVPGTYPYTRPISLLDAVMLAGGMRVFTPGGDVYISSQGQLTAAFIIRHVDGQRQVTRYDLRNFETEGNHAADTPVLPGDLVYVPESINLVYLLGEVGTPTVVPLTTNMTLLQLFAYGGGFLEETGRMRHVILLREVDPETTRISLINVRQIFKTGGDVFLQPGDIVYVPQRPLYRLSTWVSYLTGSIDPVLTMYRNYWEAYYAQERLRATIDSLEAYRSEYSGADRITPISPLAIAPITPTPTP